MCNEISFLGWPAWVSTLLVYSSFSTSVSTWHLLSVIFHISHGLEHDLMMAHRTWLVMEYRSFTQTTPTAFDLGRLDSETSALGLASSGLHTSAGELKIEPFYRKHLWGGNRGRINGISTEQNLPFLRQNKFSNSAIFTKRIQKVVQRVSWVYFSRVVQ